MCALLAIAMVPAVAGCGGDAAPPAVDRADLQRSATRFFVDGNGGSRWCAGAMTSDLATAIYKTTARCATVTRRHAAEDRADRVRVGPVKAQEATANAVVTLIGGPSDGSRGNIRFKRQRGRWKVDGLGVAFLRSMLASGTRQQMKGGLADSLLIICFTQELDKLPAGEVQSAAYSRLRHRVARAFERRVRSCFRIHQGTALRMPRRRPGTMSPLRRAFEAAVDRDLRKAHIGAVPRRCVSRQLRRRISDRELETARRKRADADLTITRAVGAATTACDAYRLPWPRKDR